MDEATGELTISLETLATEFAPISKFDTRLLDDVTEKEALLLFTALSSPDFPALSGLVEIGFDLSLLRRFLSLYAGSVIKVPQRKVWDKRWMDVHIWLAVRKGMKSSEDTALVFKAVADRYGVSPQFAEVTYLGLSRAYSKISKRKK